MRLIRMYNLSKKNKKRSILIYFLHDEFLRNSQACGLNGKRTHVAPLNGEQAHVLLNQLYIDTPLCFGCIVFYCGLHFLGCV